MSIKTYTVHADRLTRTLAEVGESIEELAQVIRNAQEPNARASQAADAIMHLAADVKAASEPES